jgi:hypothetical protein
MAVIIGKDVGSILHEEGWLENKIGRVVSIRLDLRVEDITRVTVEYAADKDFLYGLGWALQQVHKT